MAFWIRDSGDPGEDYGGRVILSKHGGENSVADDGDPFLGLIGGPFLFYNYAMSPQAVMAMYRLLPGDANLDGRVDEMDAARLVSNWQRQSGAGWIEGDFNDDGRIDGADATILAANWQRTAAANYSVPEPSTFAILVCLAAVVAVSLLFFVRKRDKRPS